MSDANLGDGTNGRLSETDVDRITIAATSAGGPGDPLLTTVAAIVREHTERAWDEGYDVGWRFDRTATNPYRAAREEQS